MTRDEVLALARQSGMSFHLGLPHEAVMEQLTRFADAVLAAQKGAPTAWATRTVGGHKFHSIHSTKASSDKWLSFRRAEQARGEQYEQVALVEAKNGGRQ